MSANIATPELLLAKIDKLTEQVVLFAQIKGFRLSRKDMIKRYGICNSTLNKRIASGTLPPPNLTGAWMMHKVFEFENNIQLQVLPDRPAGTTLYLPKQSTSPTKFALYRHFDVARNLLYVGVSINAVNRLIEHQKDSTWAEKIAFIEITYWNSRHDSLMAERYAIVNQKPLFNKQHSVVPK